MTDWNIQSRAHACTACAKPFADKEGFHTLLFDARAELRRIDVCEACWQQQYSQGARERKGFVSYWQGEYHAPTRRTEAIQKDTAESLLRKLIELNKPQYMPAGFILAVMLERKRLLRVKEQVVRDGQRVFIYEHPKSGDVFTIADPGLHLDQLDAVQRDVATLLEHGLPGDAVTGQTTDVAALAPETTPQQENASSASADEDAAPAADHKEEEAETAVRSDTPPN